MTDLRNKTDSSNDVVTIKDGQPKVTRHADSAKALVIFEYAGEKYKIFSDASTEDVGFLNNPSYNE